MADSGTIITIRLIRNFEHTNWKPFVMHGVDLSSTTTEGLMQKVYEVLPSAKLPPPFKTYKGFDTLKIETHRFDHKTSDPLINREEDEKLILRPGLSLLEQGVQHETEISFFNMVDYLEYKKTKVP